MTMNLRKRERETKKIKMNTRTLIRRTKNTQEDSSLFLDDTMMEILKRLDPKTLLRLRSVSKLWNYMIRHPYFVNLHHTFSSPTILCSIFYEPTSNNGYQGISDLYLYTISDHGGVSHYWTIKASDFGFKRIVGISDIVNGLVCLDEFNRAAVCNISTREIIYLPKTRKKSFTIAHKKQYPGRDLAWFVPYYALGFDPFTKEYKVLRTWMNTTTKFVRSEIFILGRSKYWRTIDDIPTNVQFMLKNSIHIGGSLYWLDDQLVKFNFRTEKFTTIELDSESNPNITKGRPIQVEGCFGIRCLDCIYILDEEKEVWVRKDFDIGNTILVGSSETKLFFLRKQDNQNGARTRLSFNLLRIDQKRDMKILTNITDGSFPFSSDVLKGMPCIAIEEHVENIHPLIKA